MTVCPGVTYTPFVDNLKEKTISPEAFESASNKLNHTLKQT